ncbi:MAG: amidase [Proteobacteria bacterium]|nr:amidase [Pseudomonadota bacterium]
MIVGRTLVQTADAIASGEVSAREVVAACLAQIETQQPRLNCFISVDADDALAAADAADAAQARGDRLGALHGVPLAHKDLFYRAGKVATCASEIRRGWKADVTATAIARLEAAGAITLGGLNMAEFAIGPTGHNPHWGHCRNPWDPDYISGGSSSGSGAAVGGRCIFGALGSDTGGSIRLPANFCGVVGLKPTQTRISRYGAMPVSFSLDCFGPLARTPRDVARLMQIIAGHDAQDPTSSRQPVPNYEAALGGDLKGVRVGVPVNYFYDPGIDADVERLMRHSLDALVAAGATLVEVKVPDQKRLIDFGTMVTFVEAAVVHKQWMHERPQDYSAQGLARLELGLGYPATAYLEALHLRPVLAAEFIDQVFGICDVLHTPTSPFAPKTVEETDVGASADLVTFLNNIGRCTRAFSYLGLPALSVPAGFGDNGLPVGFQLVGRPFDEAGLLRVAQAYEDSVGGLLNNETPDRARRDRVAA